MHSEMSLSQYDSDVSSRCSSAHFSKNQNESKISTIDTTEQESLVTDALSEKMQYALLGHPIQGM